jgi:uncharacterized protein YebE (UPF0316 family)
MTSEHAERLLVEILTSQKEEVELQKKILHKLENIELFATRIEVETNDICLKTTGHMHT